MFADFVLYSLAVEDKSGRYTALNSRLESKPTQPQKPNDTQ